MRSLGALPRDFLVPYFNFGPGPSLKLLKLRTWPQLKVTLTPDLFHITPFLNNSMATAIHIKPKHMRSSIIYDSTTKRSYDQSNYCLSSSARFAAIISSVTV